MAGKGATLVAHYAKQDYEFVARVMARTLDMFEDKLARAVVMYVIAQFVTEFQLDNPNFDLERFLKACKVPAEKQTDG